jgi:hypothetical protein
MKKWPLLVMLAVLVACTSSSRITSTWKNPKPHPGYYNVIVVAMTSNIEAKTTIENDLGNAIVKKGTVASRSMDVFPLNFRDRISREEMMEKIQHTSSQAIVTVSLIKKEAQPAYVPGTMGYVPYGRFWGYWNYWYPTMYSPGYYTEDEVYYMETNVYDVRTEELMWSVQSETYNPASLSGFSQDLANIIADKLVKDGIIGPPPLSPSQKNMTSRNRK